MTAHIALRIKEFDLYTGLKGWKTDEERALHIGVNMTTLHRLRKGHTAPGEKFIACVLTALPEVGFDRLFEVIRDDDKPPLPDGYPPQQ